MSGLPINAFANGRSERSTWLLLSGTASSPARTPSDSLTVIWAATGAGAKAAALQAMAAPSSAPLKVLSSIAPHLIVLCVSSSGHFDRRCRLGGRNRAGDDWLRRPDPHDRARLRRPRLRS